MQSVEQADRCLDDAFKALSLARATHEEARARTSPAPDIEKYLEASEYYKLASIQFADCSQHTSNQTEGKIWSAWKYHCLAMRHGDMANALYFNPSSDTRLIVGNTQTAISYIIHAQSIMPWEDWEQTNHRNKHYGNEQMKWKRLEHSFRALMHRAKAIGLERSARYEEASGEYLIAAEAHSNAATIADSLGDQVAQQRSMARAMSATSSAFECKASITKGKQKEKYLVEAQEMALQATRFRPHWTPLQQVLTEMMLKYEEQQRKQASRTGWTQLLIGFLLGVGADLILRIVFGI